MIGVLGIVFILGLILSVPIALTMLLAALVPGLMNPDFAADTIYIVRGIIGGADSTPILAVPLFMLSGIVMARGGISEKLFNVFVYIFGKLKGGLPCCVVITCLFYGAISGSGPATCAAVGSMAIPVLLKMGYNKEFCGGICGTAGGLGVIIPPSIPFILFGLATGASIGKLFLAGIIPGILIAVSLCGYCVYYCVRHGEDKEAIDSMVNELRARGFWTVFKDSFWALLTPVIILGGIYSGIVTPTEAACISVFYALIVSVLIYKTVRLCDMIPILSESVASYAPLCLMLALATILGRVLTLLQLPAMLSDFIVTAVGSKIMFLLVLDIILLFLGMFMDCAPAIMILGPMLLPVANAMGVDTIHLGVIMVVNLAVGFITPPFGVNLFVASRLVDVPVMKLGKKVMPFIGSFLIALLMITYVPQLSLAFAGSSTATSKNIADADSTVSGDSYEIDDAFLADDAPTYEIMLAHNTAETQLGGINCVEFAEKVEERSNGKISVVIYPNGQLGNDAENFTSTQMGTIQMCWGATGSFSSYVNDLNVLSMPMRFTDVYECYDLCKDGTEFRDYINATFEKNGLKCVGLFPTAFRTMTSNKKITSYDEFKGLNLRTMDDQYQMAFWKNVGCNATPLAWGEVYIALQQGLMDAQENPLDNAVTSNLYEVQDYIISTYHVPFVSCFVMNKDFYDSMPEAYQDMIDSVILEIAAEDIEDYDNAVRKNLDFLIEQGMEVCELGDAELDKLRAAAEPVWEQMEEDLGDVVEAFNHTLKAARQ